MSNWYVIKVLSGKERQLCKEFNEQIESGKITNIKRFVCPTEEKYVVQRNKRVLKEFVIYNGYLYFETENKLDEDELKFIGTFPFIISLFGNKKPMILTERDVKKILKDDTLEEHVESKKLKFTEGEKVTITDGPFNGFNATIKDVKHKDKVNVEVKIFDRITFIELKNNQIVKR